MTVNQKIHMLEDLKRIISDLEAKKAHTEDRIEYKKRQEEQYKDEINKEYIQKGIKDLNDEIKAIEYLKKELEKLA